MSGRNARTKFKQNWDAKHGYASRKGKQLHHLIPFAEKGVDSGLTAARERIVKKFWFDINSVANGLPLDNQIHGITTRKGYLKHLTGKMNSWKSKKGVIEGLQELKDELSLGYEALNKQFGKR